MLRRYPYQIPGRIAAALFALLGALLTWLLSVRLIPAVPLAMVPIAAGISGLAAFIVFASEADRRPPSVWQAALADGIIAGIIGAVTTALIAALVAGHAGTGNGPSTGSILPALGAAFLLGIILGGPLGLAVMLLARPTAMERRPARSTRSPRRKRSTPKRRR